MADDDRSGGDLSRRRFLILGAAAAAMAAGAPRGWAAPAQQARAASGAAAPPQLTIFSAGYPRAFAYRQSDILVTHYPYEQWAKQFSVLNGIVGKALGEEHAAQSPLVAKYFTRFKHDYPGMLVHEHFNGWARLPTFETTNWWPGFWLYTAGSWLTKGINASQTVLPVKDTSVFQIHTGAYGNRGDDVVISTVGSNGRADFTRSEQVTVTAIDPTAGTITVERAQYGTTATSFPAGAYLAAHVTRGPEDREDNWLWCYNFATDYAKDPKGNTVIDAVIQGMASGEGLAVKFASGGMLAAFTGLTLDVISFIPPVANCDVDNDGVADAGVINGVNVFGIGTIDYMNALRSMLGPDRLLVTKFGEGQRPPFAAVSGVEREGFPDLRDVDFSGWATAVAGIRFWSRFGEHPLASYPLFKFLDLKAVSYAGMRLTTAAAAVSDCLYSFFDDPDGGTATQLKVFTVWDELLGGTLQTANWLGAALGKPVHLATTTTDLLHGAGVKLSSSFMSMLTGSGVQFTRATGGGATHLVVASTEAGSTGPTGQPSLTFTIAGLPLSGSDLVLSFQVRSDPEAVYNLDIPRMVNLSLAPEGTHRQLEQATPSNGKWFTAVMYFRNLPTASAADLTVSLEGLQDVYVRDFQVFAAPDVVFRQFANGVVLANPSLQPYTFNLAELCTSGTKLRRLQATPDQDTQVNNGKAVGATVSVPAVDGLFLINQ